MLALTSCTGKLGKATLDVIVEQELIPPLKSWDELKAKDIEVRIFNFDTSHPSTFEGCTKLYLISTPNVSTDFSNAPPGQGGEKAHIWSYRSCGRYWCQVRVLHVASIWAGVRSWGHEGTFAYGSVPQGIGGREGLKVTVLGEGLYNESWPLYLGYFDPQRDERGEVLLAGEGKFSWTAIKDLGLGSALVLADGMENFVGKTLYLSRTGAARCLREIAELVAKAKGESVSVKVVGTEEYVEHYVKRGVKKSSIEWWSSTYRALEKGECLIEDPTLGELLAGRGVKPTSVKETVEDMLKHRVNDQRDT
ncbi:unnamed protein product [Diplocarpon coronariae]